MRYIFTLSVLVTVTLSLVIFTQYQEYGASLMTQAVGELVEEAVVEPEAPAEPVVEEPAAEPVAEPVVEPEEPVEEEPVESEEETKVSETFSDSLTSGDLEEEVNTSETFSDSVTSEEPEEPTEVEVISSETFADSVTSAEPVNDITEPTVVEQNIMEPVVEAVRRQLNGDIVVELLWGDLDNSVEDTVPETDWGGTIKINGGGKIKNVKPINFEGGDGFEVTGEYEFTWNSKVYSEYDGLVVEIDPGAARSEDIEVRFDNNWVEETEFTVEALDSGEKVTFPGGYSVAVKMRDSKEYQELFSEPMLIFARWGYLEGGSFDASEYEGMVTAQNLDIDFVMPIMFEKFIDGMDFKDKKGVEFTSYVEGEYWDGMLIQIKPVNDAEFVTNSVKGRGIFSRIQEGNMFTIELGDYKRMFDSEADFGMFELSDGKRLEVRKLSGNFWTDLKF